MKKIISIILAVSLIAAAFAADTTVTFKGMPTLDNRSMGMGGSHVTDTSDYFTLLRNPAGLAFSGRHNLIGVTNINLGGPFEEIFDLYNSGALSGDDPTAILEPAMGLIKDKKLNVGFNVGGPLAFGGTYNNGFGWGLYDQILFGFSAPSTIVKANMEVDLDLVFGYGHKFSFGKAGDLAVGVSTDIYSQTPYMSAKFDLFNMGGGDFMDTLTNSMALASTTGFNVNAGVQYRFLDFLDAALVYNNFFGAVQQKDINLDMLEQDPTTVLPFDGEMKTTVGAGTLDFGVGVDVPTFWSLGIISNLNVYADVKDLVGVFKADPLEKNPVLNLTFGSEITLLNCISARVGIKDSYLNAGVGLRLLGLHIDAALFGKELGKEPGEAPQFNCAISFCIKH